MRVAVIGLGEAGSVYAVDLAARGAAVIGTDVRVTDAASHIERADSIAETVRGAVIVLSLVGALSAAEVLGAALPAMDSGSIFVDMNTSAPDAKVRLAAAAAECGIPFVDAAIIAPVLRARIDTPLLVSGSGVERLLPILGGLRIPATDVGVEPGAAARLKLLRSVFMKGLAAVVVESVTAAEILGAQEWMIDQITSELGSLGRGAVAHLIDGTTKHALRREAEMIESRELLRALGAPHPMTDGAIESLHALATRWA